MHNNHDSKEQDNNINKNIFPDKKNFSASPNNFNKQNSQPLKNSLPNKLTSNGQLNKGNKINQNLNQQSKINQAKQKVIKEGAKAAANAVAGPAGGAAVEALSKSKIGKKLLNSASNKLTPGKMNPFSGNKEEEEISGSGTANISKKIMGFSIFGTFFINGCFIVVVIMAIIAIILSPLYYINEFVESSGDSLSDFGERLGNFLTFNGWCTNEECQEIAENNFYEHIDKVYDEYLTSKNVKLNVTLLTATLTYADPFTTVDDENISSFDDLSPSNYINFKKSDEKVDELAIKMVSYCCYENGNEYIVNDNHMCRGSDGKEYDGINYKCPADVYEIVNGEKVLVTEYTEKYKLDIEKYEEYLRDEFVRKFYYDNKTSPIVDTQVDNTVDEIFSRVAMYEVLENKTGSSSNFSANNSTVTILDCNNNTVIEQVSLYEYLQGVLYVEGFATGRSEEFLKAMAIAAKNYLYALNGATTDSVPTELRVRSCQMNQIYCSATKGCHSWNDGNASNCPVYNLNSTACDTIASGPDENGNYRNAPLLEDSATLEKIKNAIDATISDFIIKDGKFVSTQYRASCSGTCDSSNNIMDQAKANEMIEAGSSYKDVLNYFYNGNIEKVQLYVSGYPLDLIYNNVTSAYGWRVNPINNCCRHHNGTDIGADYEANIYAIADGTIIINQYHSSYGNYTVIGHGNLDENGQYEYYSLYAHQIRLSTLIKVGDKVKAGQQIGDVGSTGDSTGPHLHIEIYSYSGNTKIRQDPVEYFNGVELTGYVGGALYDSESDCISNSGFGSCG